MAVRESTQVPRQSIPLDRTVRALGVVSLLNDFSSEVTVRTLPLFLSNVLGVRIGIIGLIEGIAESTATLLQLISGYLSDRIGRRKALTLCCYSLSAFTKPFLYFATAGWGVVLAIRFLDRVGTDFFPIPRALRYVLCATQGERFFPIPRVATVAVAYRGVAYRGAGFPLKACGNDGLR